MDALMNTVLLESESLAWLATEHRERPWGTLVPALAQEFEIAQRELLREHPLLARIVMRLVPAFTELVSDFCIREDGVVFVHAGFWMQLAPDERRWLLGFAALTLGFAQHERGQQRSRPRWSEAVLRVANRVLDTFGGTRPPKAWRRALKAATQSDVEEYEGLPADFGAADRGPGYGLVGVRGVLVATSNALRQSKSARITGWAKHWADGLLKSKGDLPAGIARMAEEVCGPAEVDWRNRLARVTRRALQFHSSRSRPDRRLLAVRAAYPGPHDLPVFPGVAAVPPEVAVVLDTSGSMSPRELGAMLREIAALLRAHARAIRVYSCDAAVHWEGSVRDTGTIELVGGGGSSVVPAFERIAELKAPPALIVVCSDLYVTFPSIQQRPPSDVCWLVPVSLRGAAYPKPPFGEVIEVAVGD